MAGVAGRSGRRNKPTKDKEREGTLRPDRANPDEPEPEAFDDPPPCPSHLTGEARKAWGYLADELTSTGVLTTADLMALEVCSTIYAEWKEADAYLKGPAGHCPNCRPRLRKKRPFECKPNLHVELPYGPFIKTLRGWAPSPYFKALDACKKQLRAYMVEFGLTPSSRSRVKTDKKPPEDDPLMKWLNDNRSN